MDYKKIFYLIVIFDCLFLTLIGIISFRFLSVQLGKIKEVNPQILAQYNISLEVERFLNLSRELKQNTTP